MPIDENTFQNIDFGPDWARKPPDKAFSGFEPGRERSPRRGSGRRERDPGGRPGGRGPGRDRRDNRAPQDRRRAPEGRRALPPRERVVRQPVVFRFLPQQKILNDIARRIRLSKQAHSLMDVARLFLANPESCEARLEVDPEAKDLFFFQCKKCRWVGLDENVLFGHMVTKHLEEWFTKETIQVDPPSGAFSCVAECGLSGTLLGPPNHHSYAESVRQVHESRYPDMPIEQYKSRIRMLHDAEAIERWKESRSHRDVYRFKTDPEDQEPVGRAEAEERFRKEVASQLRSRSKRAVLPVPMAREIGHAGLRQQIRDFWEQEEKFPASLMSALRGAFHSKKLYLFRIGKQARYVSAIEPAPLDPEQAVDNIREVLLYLQEHREVSRDELLAGLRPGKAAESEEAKALLNPLDWLIEKGHLVEFSDGKLSVPPQIRPRPKKKVAAKPKAKPEKQPKAEAEGEAEGEAAGDGAGQENIEQPTSNAQPPSGE